jgi:hypothetical protein
MVYAKGSSVIVNIGWHTKLGFDKVKGKMAAMSTLVPASVLDTVRVWYGRASDGPPESVLSST